jgi:hypothetical protein
MIRLVEMLAHVGMPGPAPFIATGLFFLALAAAGGAAWCFAHRTTSLRRAEGIGLGALAVGCLGLATALPLLLGARPALSRPSSDARLQILSPAPGEVIRGDPAEITVRLRLEGGKIVPLNSFRLVPNEGHIHLYLDGALVSMTTSLGARVSASPGHHELRAEFVAVDHGPFDPRVLASASFSVRP